MSMGIGPYSTGLRLISLFLIKTLELNVMVCIGMPRILRFAAQPPTITQNTYAQSNLGFVFSSSGNSK